MRDLGVIRWVRAGSCVGDEGETGTSVGAWTLVWTLVVMKIVTIGVVVLAARRAEAGALFAVITWHWLVLLGALLVAPVVFRVRLRRVRARRTALLRAEWMMDEVDKVVVGPSR